MLAEWAVSIVVPTLMLAEWALSIVVPTLMLAEWALSIVVPTLMLAEWALSIVVPTLMLTEWALSIVVPTLMLAEWAVSIVVPTLMWKDYIMNSGCYRAVGLLEHAMKVVKMVLQRSLRRIVTNNEIQFAFMPERGTIDAVFILRRMLEEYHAKGKSCVFCGPRESF